MYINFYRSRCFEQVLGSQLALSCKSDTGAMCAYIYIFIQSSPMFNANLFCLPRVHPTVHKVIYEAVKCKNHNNIEKTYHITVSDL